LKLKFGIFWNLQFEFPSLFGSGYAGLGIDKSQFHDRFFSNWRAETMGCDYDVIVVGAGPGGATAARFVPGWVEDTPH